MRHPALHNSSCSSLIAKLQRSQVCSVAPFKKGSFTANWVVDTRQDNIVKLCKQLAVEHVELPTAKHLPAMLPDADSRPRLRAPKAVPAI